MNISPSPVKVYKGMKLGTVIPSTRVLLVSDEDLQTEVQSPPFDHLQFPSLSTSERTELTNLLKEFCDSFHQLMVLLGILLLSNIPHIPQEHLFTNNYTECQNP